MFARLINWIMRFLAYEAGRASAAPIIKAESDRDKIDDQVGRLSDADLDDELCDVANDNDR